LVKARVLGAWHTVSTSDWRIAPAVEEAARSFGTWTRDIVILPEVLGARVLLGTVGNPALRLGGVISQHAAGSQGGRELKQLGVLPHVALSLQSGPSIRCQPEMARTFLDEVRWPSTLSLQAGCRPEPEQCRGLVVKRSSAPAGNGSSADFAESTLSRYCAQEAAMERQFRSAEERQFMGMKSIREPAKRAGSHVGTFP
jgi:hypothetical protein